MSVSRSLLSFSLFVLLACGHSDEGSDSDAGRTAEVPAPEGPSPDPGTKAAPGLVSVRLFDAAGTLRGPIESARVEKSESDWKAQLSSLAFKVTREDGTEIAHTGALLDNKRDGVYTCVCCSLPLFSSEHKFKSGTGWPSFYQPIAASNIAEHVDNSLGMRRVEVACPRCDAHLGHVFRDGPRPTGLRYCINSVSLAFTPRERFPDLAESEARPMSERSEAVFAGGCFWCVEAVFEELEGVDDAISGYAGGTAETANYQAVCSGTTGHAEVVKIIYDPSKITFGDLLRVHFATHDPTTKDRQGNDVGPQYRSAIFYANEEEKKFAAAYIEELNEKKVFRNPVVTTLEPLTEFYTAEKKHQNFVCDNPNQGYVRAVALPKVEKVRAKFKDMLKKSPEGE